MNLNLHDYVKIYNGIIPAEICHQTIDSLQTTHWNKHRFYNPSSANYYSHEKELSSCFDIIPTTPLLMDIVWHSIRNYVTDLRFPWFDSWTGFNALKFNRYVKNTLMTNHCDHIRDIFDGEKKGVPILTIIGLLNTDFTGGEFVLFDSTTVKMSQGDILIFPANFLYPHRVDEVTNGCRYSLASWAY
jgi:hypothetical protein